MRKTLVLFSAVLVLLVTSAVPAAAQANEEGICVFFPLENGYLCSFPPFQDIDARCPAGEPAEEGDVLNCRSIETGERFTCTVLEEIIDGFVIRVFCVPAGEEQPPGAAPTALPEITQETEQEAESGEIDQSFEVS